MTFRPIYSSAIFFWIRVGMFACLVFTIQGCAQSLKQLTKVFFDDVVENMWRCLVVKRFNFWNKKRSLKLGKWWHTMRSNVIRFCFRVGMLIKCDIEFWKIDCAKIDVLLLRISGLEVQMRGEKDNIFFISFSKYQMKWIMITSENIKCGWVCQCRCY